MCTIRMLFISFDLAISGADIPEFRKAVAKKVGYQQDLFHNHQQKGGFIQRYPLIQYKRRRGLASLLAINEGIEALQHLFHQEEWTLYFKQEEHRFMIEDLQLKELDLHVKPDLCYNYYLQNWLPFNDENHRKYVQAPSITEKMQLLEKILKGHILGFATGIGWQLTEPIEISIINVFQQRNMRHKGLPFKSLTLSFRSNVFIPYFLGIGKAVSHGFGMVRQLKNSAVCGL